MDIPGRPRSKEQQLVTVETVDLRDRLNRIYNVARTNMSLVSNLGRFDTLWDLKELAVLEGRSSVDIPDSWLEELERVYTDCGISERGH